MSPNGEQDLLRAAQELASRIPPELEPLAHLAFNYRWSWDADGPDLFASIDPERWESCGHNPVRLLQETTSDALRRAASDAGLVSSAAMLFHRVGEERRRPPSLSLPGPIAFLCAEFAIHRSLPVYSGGLGVLAGDVLKEASDRALPFVGVGLFYREGYFRQRLDAGGWQHEYWTPVEPDRLPAALVTDHDANAVTVKVPIGEREVHAQIWRVDVGRVPLYLLDTDVPQNNPIDRWIAARLYIGDRHRRLQQYALLGIGAVRALRALEIDPAIVHLNEGHASLAALELTREAVEAGATLDAALAAARARTVFTTHTPVGAGNEGYKPEEARVVVAPLSRALRVEEETVLRLGRVDPDDAGQEFGITPLGLRLSRAANGVSRRHGDVAREMWRGVTRDGAPIEIGSVTNGVHVPTWMAPPVRALLSRYLGDGWENRAADTEMWKAVDSIPDGELWALRCELRRRLVEEARIRIARDRLRRGDTTEYVEAALQAFDPNAITLGFARRVATYKRLSLLTFDPARAMALLEGERPVQLLIAGKAHPNDDEAKQVIKRMFEMKSVLSVAQHVAFLDDYDLGIGSLLVRGCDVWVNLPRPPLEASGTSGMKAALNGALNLSVLDGWWAEAYDGENGWAIDGSVSADPAAQDAEHAQAFYDLLERDVVPMFYERDEHGVPQRWMRMVKSSLRTIAPVFSMTRMLEDYVAQEYLHDMK